MTFNIPESSAWRDRPRLLLVALVAAGLVACADPSGISPRAQMRDAASLGLPTGSAPAEAAKAAPSIDTRWWRSFNDEALNRLVEQALRDNPSLKVAQARLAAAQAGVEASDAARQPQVGARLDATHQRYTANGAVPPPLAGSIRDSGTVQATASWELDFFGKHRAALDAALGRAKAGEADLQAARVLLASQVARSYFQLARLQAQHEVAQQALAQAQAMLALQQKRSDAGLDSPLELRQSEARVPEARLQLEGLQEQISLTHHALAALLGQGRRQQAFEPTPLEAIQPVAVSAVMPVDLLGHRADIAAARWRVHAATESARNARLQFYPNVNLAAFAGFSSIGLEQLLNAGSQQWGISPAVNLPLFDAGRLRAGLRDKTAELDAAVESYNLAVIGAVREVADQLASVRAIDRQQSQQLASAQAVQAAYDALDRRFQAGLLGRMSVLRAQSDVLAQRRLQLDLMARALDARVALIHALGGGFSETNTQPMP